VRGIYFEFAYPWRGIDAYKLFGELLGKIRNRKKKHAVIIMRAFAKVYEKLSIMGPNFYI